MGRGSSKAGGSGGGAQKSPEDAIKEKYPKSVIGEFKDGQVTFKYSARGQEYTYKVNNMQELADKLGAKTGTGLEGNSFFGNTKKVSNDYFKMEKQVQGDTAVIATTNVVVKNGSPVLVTGNSEGIYLKDNQYQGVSVRNNGMMRDAIMVKMTKTEFESAKRYKVNTKDISVDNMTFDDFKQTAKQQQKSGNTYKTHTIAVYSDRIETSVGKKGRKIV